MTKSSPSMCSSRNFTVSCLNLFFRNILNLYSVKNVLILLFKMQLTSFPSAAYWKKKKNCLLSIVYFCLFCQRLFDHWPVGLFLGSLFCSINFCMGFLFFVFVFASTVLPWLLQLCNIAWILRELYFWFCSLPDLHWQYLVFCGSIEII